ncbi:hypothetical protein ACET3Z_026907 [Daucus carota]
MLGIMGSQRLRYPATAFDMAHCSCCLIPWSDYGLEVATNIYQHAAANTSAGKTSIPKRRGHGPGVSNVINSLNTTNGYSSRLAQG